jgi:arylsulfatase A-like enzyme
LPTIRRIIAEWNPAFSPSQVAHLRALYDREIAFTDQQIGRLMAGLRARELDASTAVVVTADHGESFGEHDRWLHGGGLYRNELRVPLLLRYPGRLPAGRVLDGPASLVDVMPTLLQLADVSIPKSVQGASLLPVLAGEEPDGQRRAFAVGSEPALSIATRGWQLIYHPADERVEVYRLATDPQQTDNLARSSEVVQDLEEAEHAKPAELDDAYEQVGDELFRELRSWQAQTTTFLPTS